MVEVLLYRSNKSETCYPAFRSKGLNQRSLTNGKQRPISKRVCRNAKFRHTLLSCVRVSKMQGAEMEDEGSVLKYMTKSEIEEQRSSLLIMTQRLFVFPTDNRFPNQGSDTQRSNAQKVRTLGRPHSLRSSMARSIFCIDRF